ncbi:Bpu10I family restriction endonuclease [Desulfococcaceae bacterium HSG8]|nr:Bpu10I family restriction endonuclease [Desulfococcaceae bacterium HSG8]
MSLTPHHDKLAAAITNPKCSADKKLLEEVSDRYEEWVNSLKSLTSVRQERVDQMVDLLNEYKDFLEVNVIAKRGSAFLKRQKGQLKLDNSVLEEFLIYLVDDRIIEGLPNDFRIDCGPHTAFMSLCFRPEGIASLNERPSVVLKQKDQDFTIGRKIHYQFSSSSAFENDRTTVGELYLSVFAAEIKVNYDKTMFQECAGTAGRLKQGCPVAKYYALVEYLDMLPEDCRLTEIDNVFLLRKAKRLPVKKRPVLAEVEKQHKDFPIAKDVIWNFVQEIQSFVNAVWYDPKEALKRGSFV